MNFDESRFLVITLDGYDFFTISPRFVINLLFTLKVTFVKSVKVFKRLEFENRVILLFIISYVIWLKEDENFVLIEHRYY